MNAPANLGRIRRQAAQPRRGLSRVEAADYLGIGTTKFDEGVAAGTIPKPKTGGFLGSRKVWDIRELDSAFDALPDAEQEQATSGNPWDAR